MTWKSTAKKALLGLALVSMAGAETVWSLALSNSPEPQCLCSDSRVDPDAAAQPQWGDADAGPCGCDSGRSPRASSPRTALPVATADSR